MFVDAENSTEDFVGLTIPIPPSLTGNANILRSTWETPTFLFVHVMCYGGGFKYVVHSTVALSNSVLLMLHSTEMCMGLTHSDSD